jgi:hypothetical protein
MSIEIMFFPDVVMDKLIANYTEHAFEFPTCVEAAISVDSESEPENDLNHVYLNPPFASELSSGLSCTWYPSQDQPSLILFHFCRKSVALLL